MSSIYKIPKGYKVAPILYGSNAYLIPENERSGQLSHKWEIYVKGPAGFIKSVTFKLHESFINNIITINQYPFVLEQYGWGEFTVQIKIILFNNDKVSFSHFLKLHPTKNNTQKKSLDSLDENDDVVKSEKKDTVFYKGNVKFSEEDCKPFLILNDSDEFNRIEKAIDRTITDLEKQEY